MTEQFAAATPDRSAFVPVPSTVGEDSNTNTHRVPAGALELFKADPPAVQTAAVDFLTSLVDQPEGVYIVATDAYNRYGRVGPVYASKWVWNVIRDRLRFSGVVRLLGVRVVTKHEHADHKNARKFALTPPWAAKPVITMNMNVPAEKPQVFVRKSGQAMRPATQPVTASTATAPASLSTTAPDPTVSEATTHMLASNTVSASRTSARAPKHTPPPAAPRSATASASAPAAAPVSMPVAAITSDGIIGQIEHWTGAKLEYVPRSNGPVGHVVIAEEDLSKLLAVCQFKRDYEERRRAEALAAIQAEVVVDKSRFLDPAQFQAELPDLPVSSVTPISRREPSPEARAKALAAGNKMLNTKRIQRFAADGKIAKGDVPYLRAIVNLMAEFSDTSAPIRPADARECVPLEVSQESVTAMLDYLTRHNVIGFVGSGEDKSYYASAKSTDRLESLIKLAAAK